MIDKTRHRTSARRRQAVSRLSALLAGCIACLLASGAIAAPDNYLSAARDIPLLPGLQDRADGGHQALKPRPPDIAGQTPWADARHIKRLADIDIAQA